MIAQSTKLIIPGLSLVVILFAASFQNRVAGDSGKPRIKKITNLVTNNYSEYFFNESGQILQIKYSKGNTIEYEYLTNKVVKTSHLKSGVSTDTFFLTKAGLIDQVYLGSRYVVKYEFTSGFSTSERRFYGDNIESTLKQVITNGNITSSTDMVNTSDGKKINANYYEYYPNKSNSIGNENMGMSFMGKSSTNLVKETINVMDKDTSRFISNYHFDDKGRVSISVGYFKSGKLADSTGYTYY